MFLPGVVEGVEHPVLPTARLRPTRGAPAAGWRAAAVAHVAGAAL